MPTISPYTQELHISQYQPTDYSVNLELAVATHQQQNYDRVLNSVRNLQSQALNIQMLNSEGKQRLDQYNKQISEELSGDIGDLNKVEVQNKIANVFQTIAGDTQLVKASQLSGEYQKQIDTIESYRASGRKDKGYNTINETVFREWDGGLYDFMGSDLNKVTSPEFRPTKYTPFKELDTKLLNIAKTLHESSTIQEGMSGSEGYLLHQERSGVSPERIRQMMLTQFDQEDLEQLDVLSKYEVIKNRKLGTIPEFHAKYNLYADNEIKRTSSQADIKKQQAEYYQTLINDAKTSPEKKAEYIQLVTALNQESSLYADAANQLLASKKTVQDFEGMSNEELAQYSSAIQWNTKVNGLADALSWKKEVDTYKLDQVWKVNKEIDAMRWREELRASTKLATERMRREAESKIKAPVFTGPMDTVKNTIEFYDSYKTLTNESERYGKLSDQIISTAPPERYAEIGKRLLDPVFLADMKDNYEVKMWDIFSHEKPTLAIKNGTPQIEAFKMWLLDKEANPTGVAGQYIEENEWNKLKSDWLDKKVSDINKLTREATNEFDLLEGYPMYKADGSILSRDEYNKGVPAYLGVPTNTGLKLMAVDQVIEEVKLNKSQQRNQQRIENNSIATPPGGALDLMTRFSNSLDSQGDYLSYQGVIQDQGLINRIEQLIEQKENVNAQLEAQLVGELPQIFQTPLVEAVNDEAKLIYYPDVASAAKNVNNKNAQFGLSMDDIAFIRPPTVGNKGQFQLKPTLSENYGELGWQLPDAEDPKKMINIVPGGTYSFFTNKPYMPQDILLNEIVKDMPITQGYKGYTIVASKSKTTGNTYVTITSPKGELVEQGEESRPVDIMKALEAAKYIVEGDINKGKK